MVKKRNPPDLTKRNQESLLKRIRRLEQSVILLHGDINKIRRQMVELYPVNPGVRP